jgi:cytidine deaminase
VGAAVLGASGRVFTGCNVENSSYGLALCAERNAVGQAVAAGDRALLAVAVAVSGRPCPPCGMCRQVLFEFGSPDLVVALVGSKARAVHTLRELLPHAFGRDFL